MVVGHSRGRVLNAFRTFSPLTEEQIAASLRNTLTHFLPSAPHLHLFAYAFFGSLMWHPLLASLQTFPAIMRKHHRALCVWSVIHRGSLDSPGVVLGLDRGGFCKGVCVRIPREHVNDVLPTIWAQEMEGGAYEPKWAHIELSHRGTDVDDEMNIARRRRTVERYAEHVDAIAFVVDRRSPLYIPLGSLTREEIISHVLAARGKGGSCAEYIIRTVNALEEMGIRDRQLDVIVAELAHKQENA